MSETDARFADLLVRYCLQLEPDDRILIEAHTPAIPFLKHLARTILRAGAIPVLDLLDDDFVEVVFEEADEEQWRGVLSLERFAYESFEGRIRILSARNTKSLGHIGSGAITAFSRIFAAITELQFNREAAGDFKRVTTIYPTAGYAQDAGMGTQEFARLVYSACHLDNPEENTISYWESRGKRDAELAKSMSGSKYVSLRSPNCDLTFSIEGRKFIADDGRRNMPAGEIFTAPVKDSVQGKIKFTLPASMGARLAGVELVFHDGQVVEAKADHGEDALLGLIATDEGSKYVGEFGIGTNYGIEKPTGNALLDEKIGGTIHIALGRAYPEVGGKNQSGIHVDLVTDMSNEAEIEIDGIIVYRDGNFVI